MFKRSIRASLALAITTCLSGPALPQVRPASSVNASSTIAVTNTFQSVFSRSPNRSGCSIQNNGTNTMWVFYGDIADATKAKSVVLAAGYGSSCNNGPLVVTDQVSITGTAADAFFAASQ